MPLVLRCTEFALSTLALESLDVDIEYAAEQIQELSKALAFQERMYFSILAAHTHRG